MSSSNFLLKNAFKVTVQYLFNVVILLSTVNNLKLSFKLKINSKTSNFKNLKQTSQKVWQPCCLSQNSFSKRAFTLNNIFRGFKSLL